MHQMGIHVTRTAAAVLIQRDGDHITIALMLGIDQRVTAHRAIGQLHINMCPGLEPRQLAAIG